MVKSHAEYKSEVLGEMWSDPEPKVSCAWPGCGREMELADARHIGIGQSNKLKGTPRHRLTVPQIAEAGCFLCEEHIPPARRKAKDSGFELGIFFLRDSIDALANNRREHALRLEEEERQRAAQRAQEKAEMNYMADFGPTKPVGSAAVRTKLTLHFPKTGTDS